MMRSETLYLVRVSTADARPLSLDDSAGAAAATPFDEAEACTRAIGTRRSVTGDEKDMAATALHSRVNANLRVECSKTSVCQ